MSFHAFSIIATTVAASSSSSTFALLYLGPETIMPLASLIAALLGFILIFWKFIANSVKKMVQAITGKSSGQDLGAAELQDTADETKDELPSI